MKEMFRSFRIFTGNYTIKNTLQMLGVFTAIFGAMSLLSAVPVNEDSFAAGFFSGFLPGFSMFVPMTGGFLINAIYMYNLPITPGYKYLHSLPDSAKAYREAIMIGNLYALVMMFAALGMHSVVHVLCDLSITPIYSAAVTLLAIGCINFLGNFKNQIVRTFIMVPLFVGSGFVFGFSAALEEDGKALPDFVLWIALGAAIAVYIGGLVFSLAVCEKKWRRG